MKIPGKYNDIIRDLDIELTKKTIRPSNLIPIILLALEIYNDKESK